MKPTRMIVVLFSVAAMALAATAQEPASLENPDAAKKFYEHTKAVPAAYLSGDIESAKTLARELLVEAANWKDNWNYGNAIHTGHLVLGRAALGAGDLKEAKRRLLAAGNTPGSPQLDSFGPDMLFAKELLAKGESDAVLVYFELCAKFWVKHQSSLDEWTAQVKRGEVPDFGPNERYVFASH